MRTYSIRTCVLVFVAAMLVSMLAKQASYCARAPYASRGSASLGFFRAFAFSSRANSGKGENSLSGSSSTAHDAQGSIPTAPLSASNNYDKSSLTKLNFYEVALAFQPKNRKELNVFRRKSNAAKLPAQLSPTGEDNLFVSSQSSAGWVAVGVADGVGGWSEAGYDSSAISRELCYSMKTNFEKTEEKSPKILLKGAFEDVLLSPKVEIGGTTACLGIFSPDMKLRVANLGDSWCGIFRNFKLVEETEFQTHNFNTPYQLAKIPKQVLRQAELQGKRYIIDKPEMSDEYVWELQKDDIVIFATDGVTDNIIPQDIELFLKDQDLLGSSLAQVSSKLVQEVVKVSKDPNFPSAFAQELSRITGQKYLGGKEDDVTLVMVKVK